MLLKVDNISVYYEKAMAVEGVSLEVEDGSVVCVIGANGAGKSTIMKAISGMVPLTDGNIYYNGQNINKLSPSARVNMGIIQVPEGRRLFPFISVIDNLTLGASTRKDKDGINKDLSMVFQHFPVLDKRRSQRAGTLSGGEQQMLAIGRGLMSKPKLLILDEPSLGLAPKMVDELVPVIRDINKSGISVLLVEQNIPLAMCVAKKGYALQVGKVVLEGDIKNFISSEVLKAAYLGQ